MEGRQTLLQQRHSHTTTMLCERPAETAHAHTQGRGRREVSWGRSDIMAVTQATKQKSPGLSQRGCKCSKAQGAPLRHRGSSARKSHPQGRVEQPSQSLGPGVPRRGARETGVWRATPARLLLRSVIGQRRGGSLEGILLEA